MRSPNDDLTLGSPTQQGSPPQSFTTDASTQAPWSTRNPITPLAETTPASTPLTQRPQRPKRGRQLVTLLLVVSLLVVVSIVLLPTIFAPPTSALIVPSHQPGSSPAFVGLLGFTSSGQLDPTSSTGLNDGVALSLANVAAPPVGMSLYAWLMSDSGADTIAPILLGALQVSPDGRAQLSYQDPHHVDLLVNYSRVLVTQQASTTTPSFLPPLDPKTWKYQGAIPNTPTPGDEQGYSLLAHMRHLLAWDPTLQDLGLQGGLDIWLYRNTGKVFEWANAARDDWGAGAGSTTLIRQLADRVVEYMDGAVYAGLDLPAGTPWLVDPQAGRPGLIDVSTAAEEPPSYVSHVRLHLTGLVEAPGHTQAQAAVARQVDTALTQIEMVMRQVRKDAIQLAAMNTSQLESQTALTLLNEMQVNTSNAYIGQTGGTTGVVPGVVWIHASLQQLARIDILTVS